MVSGISGRRIPVDESHHSTDLGKGTETMARVEDCWRIDISFGHWWRRARQRPCWRMRRWRGHHLLSHLRHHRNLLDQGTNRSRLRRRVGQIYLRVWSGANWYWSGQSICNYIFCAWKVNNLAVELGMHERRPCCMADQGRVVLNKACVKGLWSEKRTNSLPSGNRQQTTLYRRRNILTWWRKVSWSRWTEEPRSLLLSAREPLQRENRKHRQRRRFWRLDLGEPGWECWQGWQIWHRRMSPAWIESRLKINFFPSKPWLGEKKFCCSSDETSVKVDDSQKTQ